MNASSKADRARIGILVVDDDLMIREVLVKTLRHAGYRAEQVADSRETLAVVASMKPDVVLLDLVMPERDGFELLQEMRIAHPNVSVVAMTGGGRMAASQLLRLASMLGAVQVLPKPFTIDLVEVTLAAVMETRRKAAEARARSTTESAGSSI